MMPLSGTYVLVLKSQRSATARIRRWGRLDIRQGHYCYVGSAFVPGGVRARVARHCREPKSRHWHIDYLRDFAVPVAVWCSYEPVHLEHRWARALEQFADAEPIVGFGCKDCSCAAHLFFSVNPPDSAEFSALVNSTVEYLSL